MTGLLILTVALGVLAYWKRAELVRLRAVMTLFAPDRIVHNFSNMNELFHTTPVPRGAGPVSELPRGAPMSAPEGWEDWLARHAVTSIVVLENGAIVHESYLQGTGQDDLRVTWSVAKSWFSALFGVLVAEGHLESLDDEVVKYAPQLRGSAYDGASIRNVLNMASGVEFNEDYLDFWSDINRMGRVLAIGGSMDKFAMRLGGRMAPPGEKWQYVSIDTHVLGMVARGATGRAIPDLISERIVAPMGLESEPYYLTDIYGTAFVTGGLNMRTRDFARFGQMFLQEGFWNGRQIVPRDWALESTRPSAPTVPGELRYGYQWWIPETGPEGEFLARGVYGQYVYVNRPAGVVVAVTSADRQFREAGVFEDSLAMFRSLAAHLSE
ncbi:serine hydrolase [Ostreiculturibacter nitratireducens]|uniref:serine hydrolase domain-containing protein n=1 Tax=Ostreiculturibacter nitratireducens TaxID=3075226 RepID=UPI0031B5CA1E